MKKEEITKLLENVATPIYLIEEMLGMPKTTLQKAVKGKRDLPKRWAIELRKNFGSNYVENVDTTNYVFKPIKPFRTLPKNQLDIERKKIADAQKAVTDEYMDKLNSSSIKESDLPTPKQTNNKVEFESSIDRKLREALEKVKKTGKLS